MTPLTTAQIPTVGLEFMNHDHAEAAQQINQLDYLISQANEGDNTALSAIEPLLTEIYAHNQSHFAREEAQMVRVGFPAYECHKGEHERVLEEFRQLLVQWQDHADLTLLAAYLNDILCQWLIQHISTMDSVTAMFVNRHDCSAA
ncbi:bacteriohemerythrin [Amphritea sp.]|uniref:bacteriohemerythrin n=1 Tax=Amphritea sp. TaxID=1872502 RepID=UPI003A8CD1C8